MGPRPPHTEKEREIRYYSCIQIPYLFKLNVSQQIQSREGIITRTNDHERCSKRCDNGPYEESFTMAGGAIVQEGAEMSDRFEARDNGLGVYEGHLKGKQQRIQT